MNNNADFEDDPLEQPYTGHRFLRKQAGAENLLEYGPLHGASVNDKWAPSDIDGMTERFGNFLIWELKQPDEEISEGQRILLEALAREPNKVVFVFRLSGQRDANGARLFFPTHLLRVGKHTDFIPTDIEKVRRIYDQFFTWAERNPCSGVTRND